MGTAYNKNIERDKNKFLHYNLILQFNLTTPSAAPEADGVVFYF